LRAGALGKKRRQRVTVQKGKSKEISWRLLRAYELAAFMDPKDLNLQQLSEVSGVSVFHLSRSFIKLSGCPFEAYKMRRRLEKAKRLLTETTDPIKKISDVLGCCSPELFTHNFKVATGFTPTAYRNSHWRDRKHALLRPSGLYIGMLGQENRGK
jgi:AraC-like DNA-binding protein